MIVSSRSLHGFGRVFQSGRRMVGFRGVIEDNSMAASSRPRDYSRAMATGPQMSLGHVTHGVDGRMHYGRVFVSRGGRTLGGFGSVSFGDAKQDDWCNQNYPDATMNGKCKQGFDLFSCPACVSPPWTAEGKLARGLTDVMGAAAQAISSIKGGSSSSSSSAPASGGGGGGGAAKSAAASTTIMGVPKTIMLVGGGFLALGAVAVALKMNKKGRR